MSNTEVLQYVAVGAFVLAAVFAILAIILFFRLDIRSVVGDLTGKTVAREIRSMQEENKHAEASKKASRIPQGQATSTNLSRSKILSRRQKIKEENRAEVLDAEATTLLQPDADATTLLDQDPYGTTVLQPDLDATTLLGQDPYGTTVLQPETGATTLLGQDPYQTTLLQPDSDATTLLSAAGAASTGATADLGTTLSGQDRSTGSPGPFTVCNTIMVVHTDEIVA